MLHRPRAASAPEPAPAPARSAGPGTILLVEDEHELRLLVQEVLAAAGYTVLVTTGPAEALRLARGTPGAIDLLLTDIVMPDMNGLALAERLQADRPAMQVLYMTGYGHDVVMAHGTPLEGLLVQKPFTPRHLVARVRELLGSAGTRAS